MVCVALLLIPSEKARAQILTTDIANALAFVTELINTGSMVTDALDQYAHINENWKTFQDKMTEIKKKYEKIEEALQYTRAAQQLVSEFNALESTRKYYTQFYSNYEFDMGSLSQAMRGPLVMYNQGQQFYKDASEFIKMVKDGATKSEIMSFTKKTGDSLAVKHQEMTAAAVNQLMNTARMTSGSDMIGINAFNSVPASGLDVNFGLGENSSISSEAVELDESKTEVLSLASGWQGIVQLLLILAGAFCLVMSGIKFSQGNPEGTRMFLTWTVTLTVSFIILAAINAVFIKGY